LTVRPLTCIVTYPTGADGKELALPAIADVVIEAAVRLGSEGILTAPVNVGDSKDAFLEVNCVTCEWSVPISPDPDAIDPTWLVT
jgi:hypothetical protein